MKSLVWLAILYLLVHSNAATSTKLRDLFKAIDSSRISDDQFQNYNYSNLTYCKHPTINEFPPDFVPFTEFPILSLF